MTWDHPFRLADHAALDVRPAARRRAGFTLMEMLVVISLIVLLIAMLMPALSKSRENARNVSCLSNIRQIGLAMTYYTDANKGHFVPYKTPYQPTPQAYWCGLLAQARYIDFGPAFSCPSYLPKRNLHLQANNTDPGGNWFYTHYGINWQHLGTRYGQYGATGAGIGTPPLGTPTPKMGEIAYPTLTIAAVDSYGKVWADTLNESGINFVGDSDSSSATGAPDVRHNSGLNVLFADTHARSIRCTNPFNPYTPDALTDADLNPNDNLWDIK